VGQAYFSSFSSNKRGTAILVNKNVPVIFERQFILITDNILGKCIWPNSDSPKYMSTMILLFNQHCKGLEFISGDFKYILGKLDKSSTAVTP
jgi:hypothetical protein